MMDFSGFTNFPFPAALAIEDAPVRDYFYTLEDEVQLELLNQCHSYDEFKESVKAKMLSE